MQKYIGTKTVMAEPMTKGAAFEAGLLRVGTLPAFEEYIQGYKVKYDNGYESWTPADVFNAAYKLAETSLDRVNIEYKDTVKRINELGEFIYNQNDGKNFQALPLGTRANLIALHDAIGNCLNALDFLQYALDRKIESRPCNFSFEQVLPLLKNGYAIRRSGWNGKGLMVFKQVPAHITSDIIPNMQSLPDEAKRLILEHTDHIDYTCQCLIFNPETGRADSWVPSISDVFANDWELVIEK